MKKILIAEDDELLIKLVQIRLEKDGHEIIPVINGAEVMKIIDTTDIDLVLTDIMMPYTTGLEIISYIRANSKRYIPIIVLSNMALESTILEAFSLGADDFINKPFSPNELSVRVKRLLARNF